MTTFLYLLIAALIFGVIGYILASMNCTGRERYRNSTLVDPVTEDDGSCEDAEAKAAKETAKADEAVAQIKAEKEATAAQEKADAKAKAEKEATALAAAAAASKASQEKADKEKAEAEAKKEAEVTAAAAAKKKEAEEKAAEKPTTEEAPAGAAPEGLLSAPRGGKKDNLTRIKGIGLKIDAALNGIGIYHFDQIAAWTEENMAWADAALAFPGRAKRDDWVGQAALLAKGKETEFSQRVDKGEVASSKKA